MTRLVGVDHQRSSTGRKFGWIWHGCGASLEAKRFYRQVSAGWVDCCVVSRHAVCVPFHSLMTTHRSLVVAAVLLAMRSTSVRFNADNLVAHQAWSLAEFWDRNV